MSLPDGRFARVARVAIVGSYGVGLTVELDRVPDAGETVIGRTFRRDHGGKGSNQAVGCARLGAEVDFLTAIGDDAFGQDALTLWREENVRAEAVIAAAATMVAPIFVEATGENRIVVVPGALAELSRAHVDAFAGRIAAADICVVQLEIPLDTALYALEVARAAGVRTILNPAPAPTRPIAPIVDYLTPNESEAAAVSGARGTFVLTLGDRGAQLGDQHVAAFPANVVDTTGAGDAFTAAFAVALSEGLSDLDAVRWGCAAGAHMVEHPGVVPGLPTPVELEERLAAAPD
jgi:ribokinase